MKKEFEILRTAIEKMEIVTISSAIELTALNRQEIIDFIRSHPSLRIFDDEKKCWMNENVDGHC